MAGLSSHEQFLSPPPSQESDELVPIQMIRRLLPPDTILIPRSTLDDCNGAGWKALEFQIEKGYTVAVDRPSARTRKPRRKCQSDESEDGESDADVSTLLTPPDEPGHSMRHPSHQFQSLATAVNESPQPVSLMAGPHRTSLTHCDMNAGGHAVQDPAESTSNQHLGGLPSRKRKRAISDGATPPVMTDGNFNGADTSEPVTSLSSSRINGESGLVPSHSLMNGHQISTCVSRPCLSETNHGPQLQAQASDQQAQPNAAFTANDPERPQRPLANFWNWLRNQGDGTPSTSGDVPWQDMPWQPMRRIKFALQSQGHGPFSDVRLDEENTKIDKEMIYADSGKLQEALNDFAKERGLPPATIATKAEEEQNQIGEHNLPSASPEPWHLVFENIGDDHDNPSDNTGGCNPS